MIDAPSVAGAEVEGESGCNGAPSAWFSQEDRLLKRLQEVERYDTIEFQLGEISHYFVSNLATGVIYCSLFVRIEPIKHARHFPACFVAAF